MAIKNWSTTPANNNSAPPNGWPEGQLPSTVNDCARQMMADIRTQCENSEWFDYGDTPTRLSASTFKIAADVTARYPVGLRLKCNDSSTLYGAVTAVSYSAPDTTVTVVLDSGSLSVSLSSIARSVLSPTNKSLPTNMGYKGADLASAATVTLASASGDFVDITGTTTITSFGVADSGIVKTVRFTGALTLTHNATSLILPGGVNITTSNGDTAIFRSLGSGNWLCIIYKTSVNGALLNVSTTQRIIGRKSVGAGAAEECTLTEVLDFVGTVAQGDLLYRGASSWQRLPAGNPGDSLQSQGAGANPQWGAGGTSGFGNYIVLGQALYSF